MEGEVEEKQSVLVGLARHKLTQADLTKPAAELVKKLADECEEWIRANANEEIDQDGLENVLAISWGLMAIDPHHSRFARLLKDALSLDPNGEPMLELFGQRISFPEKKTRHERAEWLVKQALGSELHDIPPGVLMVKAAHLFCSADSTDEEGDDNEAWLAEVLEGKWWGWPSGGAGQLSHRHLLALDRARDHFGHAFMGYELGCLVAKALLSFAWSPAAPVQDQEWLDACVNILRIRYAGLPDDNRGLSECKDGLAPELKELFDNKNTRAPRNEQSRGESAAAKRELVVCGTSSKNKLPSRGESTAAPRKRKVGGKEISKPELRKLGKCLSKNPDREVSPETKPTASAKSTDPNRERKRKRVEHESPNRERAAAADRAVSPETKPTASAKSTDPNRERKRKRVEHESPNREKAVLGQPGMNLSTP